MREDARRRVGWPNPVGLPRVSEVPPFNEGNPTVRTRQLGAVAIVSASPLLVEDAVVSEVPLSPEPSSHSPHRERSPTLLVHRTFDVGTKQVGRPAHGGSKPAEPARWRPSVSQAPPAVCAGRRCPFLPAEASPHRERSPTHWRNHPRNGRESAIVSEVPPSTLTSGPSHRERSPTRP